MSVDHDRVLLLERQRATIDRLSTEVDELAGNGSRDVEAEKLLRLLCRSHRQSLARTPVETLFHYACRYAESRQA